jgi:hypothetical protein
LSTYLCGIDVVQGDLLLYAIVFNEDEGNEAIDMMLGEMAL